MGREEMVPLTEARMRLYQLVRGLPDRDVLLLRHGRPVAVLIDYEAYVDLLEGIEDLKDRLAVFEGREESSDMNVPWEKAKAELGLVAE